jgi:hypothetical protein
MLADPEYEEAFQYVPVNERREGEERSLRSERVQQMLNIAYMPESKQSTFKFGGKAAAAIGMGFAKSFGKTIN